MEERKPLYRIEIKALTELKAGYTPTTLAGRRMQFREPIVSIAEVDIKDIGRVRRRITELVQEGNGDPITITLYNDGTID